MSAEGRDCDDARLTVTVLPATLTFSAARGERLMEAANHAGIFWPTVCGGEGTCAACVSVVPTEHREALSEPSPGEQATLARTGRSAETYRLACQARLTGTSLTVTHRRVRLAQPGDRLPFGTPEQMLPEGNT